MSTTHIVHVADPEGDGIRIELDRVGHHVHGTVTEGEPSAAQSR